MKDRSKLIRTATAAAVLIVAAVAAIISSIHIVSVALELHQPRAAAFLLPLSVDGCVLASSLTLLQAARSGLPAPRLAQVMLCASVAATLACNVGFGWRAGLPGALLSGWPALAFIGSAEVAIGWARTTARPDALAGAPLTHSDALDNAPLTHSDALAHSDALGDAPTQPAREDDARAALADALLTHTKVSQRALMRDYGISRAAETRIRAEVTASLNGRAA